MKMMWIQLLVIDIPGVLCLNADITDSHYTNDLGFILGGDKAAGQDIQAIGHIQEIIIQARQELTRL